MFMSRTICAIGLYLIVALILGCTQTRRYTSQDLTILPCEQKANKFFFSLECDEEGHSIYKDQVSAIENALQHAERIYVFVHGWNKNPELAERDYQDLICRFYTHSRRAEDEAKRSIIIGVFWLSTDFPPLLNFWRMKSRAADLYKMMSRQHQSAMKEIHKFRQMGEVGLEVVDKVNTLAFSVNESLRKRDWIEAEKGIREITSQKYFYPGWHIQADLGLIEKGLFGDSSRVRAEGTPLTKLTIHLLLAYVLLQQDNCAEVGNEARIGISGMTEWYSYKEG